MPGVELTDTTALIPLLNVALLIKAAVLGNVTVTQVVLTAVSVLLCALLALVAAARAFRREVFAQPPAGTGAATQSKPEKAV
jgi:sodium transport system permease protein